MFTARLGGSLALPGILSDTINIRSKQLARSNPAIARRIFEVADVSVSLTAAVP
jgi:hypothetical protein